VLLPRARRHPAGLEDVRDVLVPGQAVGPGRYGVLRLLVRREAAQAQRQLAELGQQRHRFRLLRRHLEGCGLGFVVRLAGLGIVVEHGAHGDDAQVLENGLADPARLAAAVAGGQGLGQDQIDPVAREDQAGVARDRRDRHRHRAHAGREHRGQEATIARLDHGAVGDRLAGGDQAADHSADHVGVGPLAAQHVAVRHVGGRPALPTEVLRLEEGAGRQIEVGDQNLVDLLLGGRRGDGSGLLALDPAASVHRRAAGGDHGDPQTDDAMHTHGVCLLRAPSTG
jgi:hypothetical protein